VEMNRALNTGKPQITCLTPLEGFWDCSEFGNWKCPVWGHGYYCLIYSAAKLCYSRNLAIGFNGLCEPQNLKVSWRQANGLSFRALDNFGPIFVNWKLRVQNQDGYSETKGPKLRRFQWD
jgi:hypothetical protein